MLKTEIKVLIKSLITIEKYFDLSRDNQDDLIIPTPDRTKFIEHSSSQICENRNVWIHFMLLMTFLMCTNSKNLITPFVWYCKLYWDSIIGMIFVIMVSLLEHNKTNYLQALKV